MMVVQFEHQRVSRLVANLLKIAADKEERGGATFERSIIAKLQRDAKAYHCNECGWSGEDPFVGMADSDPAAIVMYCVPCNNPLKEQP